MATSNFALRTGVMPRASAYGKYPGGWWGDSIVYNTTYPVPYFPDLVNTAIGPSGLDTLATMTNFGQSGDTSSQVMAKILLASPVRSGTPGGVSVVDNDYNSGNITTVQASPAPTSTAIQVGAGVGAAYKVGTNILVGGVSRKVLSVAGDLVTVTVAFDVTPVAGAAVRIDSYQNLYDSGVLLQARGYTRIIFGIWHYLNYSAGGDTLSSQEGTSATVRALQRSVVTALQAAYGADKIVQADVYAYFRNLIVNGTVVQGSFSWHVADVNAHLNAGGESYYKDCVMANWPAAWTTALRY